MPPRNTIHVSTIIVAALMVLSAVGMGYIIASTIRNPPSLPLGMRAVAGSPTPPSASSTPPQTAVLGAVVEVTTGPSDSAGIQPIPSILQPAPSPIEQPPAMTPIGQVVMTESFDVPSNNWLARQSATSRADYVQGSYELVLNGENSIGVTSQLSMEAYRISLDVQVQAGDAGIVFLAEDPATFYRLLVRADGTYAIQAFQQNANVIDNLVDWSESTALKRGTNAVNQLAVERQGPALRCFINGQQVGQFIVPSRSFTSQYGVALVSATGQGQARFDDLTIEQLES